MLIVPELNETRVGIFFDRTEYVINSSLDDNNVLIRKIEIYICIAEGLVDDFPEIEFLRKAKIVSKKTFDNELRKLKEKGHSQYEQTAINLLEDK